MSQLSLQDYCKTLQASGLISVDAMRERYKVFRDICDGDPKSKSALAFADFLQSDGKLTEWQNEKLLRGKYRGLKLGKFHIQDLLGVGGMGRVFLAEDEILQRRVAIKVLPSERCQESDSLQRFYLEARALARLNHNNIVRVHDVSAEGARHFIVMEYVDGINLYKKIRRDGPSTPREAIDFVRQSASGLQHAHDAGLIHRDIKPPNLLLDLDGNVKILDLGLARLMADDAENVESGNGKTVGTADFMSPEQTRGLSDVDHRTDIYSLGCTLFFLLTGRPPFKSRSIKQKLMAHRTELPPAINPFRTKKGLPTISPELAILCGRMMAKQPSERFESAAALIESLNELPEKQHEEQHEQLDESAEIATDEQKRTGWDDPFWDE
ncbi:serine/threonine protein kinase [Stieleria varia]|uniref:Serine/threonine-protein kinase PknB n=1 Tax=Stieleria varia TaxID=2528005 RepID=A0A5C6B0W5_9BACT|nr:serine/threonine-protein kinase [Stieleria varia]TWU05099.1 Serine/threonine-protein kinase PknB [Stieleria varia]